MKEDKLVPQLIELDSPTELKSDLTHDVDLSVEIESHYNHYGNRGAVDLVTRLTGESEFTPVPKVRVYEIKSTHAVEKATGANEILRQFNKHRKYHFKDESNALGAENVFELVFIPTKKTVKHVFDNYQIYLSAGKGFPNRITDPKPQARIMFRSPSSDDHNPAHALTDSDHAPGIDEPEKYIQHSSEIVSDAADDVASILKKLDLS